MVRFAALVTAVGAVEPEVIYITVPEDEDAGALQALVEFHAAVQLSTNSFRNV